LPQWNILISLKNDKSTNVIKNKTAKARKQQGKNESFALKFDDDESQEAFPESR